MAMVRLMTDLRLNFNRIYVATDYMNRIYIHIIHIGLAMLLLAGCKSDYPHIEYNGNPGTVEFDNIDARVPIMVAINDPLYQNYTRGVGAFDNVMDENGINENWKNADIFVYAFYTPDGMANTPSNTNYSERMDSKDANKIYCLVDDADNDNIGHGKKARLNRDMTSFLQWTDNDMVYYNGTYPQYRYRFFAYHIDDAADMSKKPERKSDYVSYDVQIDGTQDLMCSYAQPTAEQLARMENLASPGNKNFVNNLSKLIYSTETGHRDLFPIFKMDHQLAYVRFFLKADSITDASGNKMMDPEIAMVRVENIVINERYHGEFIVAAEETGRLGVNFTNEKRNYYMPVKVKTDAYGDVVTDAEGHRITVSRDEEGVVMAGDSDGFNPRLIPSAKECEVGMGILLPPADKYSLKLLCKQLKTDEDGNQEEIPYQHDQAYELMLPNGKSFEAGRKYEVVIKVYGLRNIVLQLGDVQWKDGGSIDIDEDQ